jgi:hypothetical protein
MEFDLYRTFSSGGDVARVFQKRLLDEFAFPPITAHELCEIAVEQLSGASSPEDFATAITRFWVCVAKATYYSTEDINLKEVDAKINSFWPLVQGTVLESVCEDCETIWRSKHGFWLTLNSENVFSLKSTVWGKFSDRALQSVSSVMSRLLPSASITLHLIHSDPCKRDDFHFVPFEVDFDQVANDIAAKERGFFSALLSHYFHPPAKKMSSIEQRLRNAVHLLVEADAQSNQSISLSLSFAAVEALVCKNTSGIVDELSRNVAALLQPKAMDRPAVIKAIKDLYDIRSKVLHGEQLKGDENTRWQVRILASAVLKGVTDWFEHVRRIGGEPKREEFLEELGTSATTGQQMVGVASELSRLLPSHNTSS